jgi:DNA-binding IclR family transcriptional regulator
MSKAAVVRRPLPGRPSTRDPLDAGNRSTLVALNLLKAVAEMRAPATLTEISETTGMAISRAYRYLTSMAQTGFVQHDPATGKYDLGLASLQLGVAAMARVDAVRYAGDVMRSLTEEAQLVSILCVWGSNGPTVIKWERGRLEMAVHTQEGLNLSLPITAAGRVFMTYLEEGQVAPVLRRDLRAWNASAPANRRITDKMLDTIRKEVRGLGIARTTGLRTPNVAALAAPVFDQQGRLVMAISLVGVIGTIDMSIASNAARKLKAATEKLSRMLGAPESCEGAPERSR